ncbi:helix-turn-helix domain protein [Isosphaera pallida ATCC 43644]|uniref:Helix-turn-helix domain protein n=1 Tax=Isosphaera pallida (strain ATCC 43644 / DSM 9630 / IS1B) TaxID=575540 RepID=E8QYZ5_ISOPI|nr:helix-turn-helix transcriptional regulator [Isosphaera pallida]ADV62132.1 helix-turn-helix domain protein [Isosphaera pallida ATCC 43644]
MLGDMGFSENLRQICALRGIDQGTLAEKVNVSKSSMSRIWNGNQEPKIKLAYEMAKILEVPLDRLVSEEGVESQGYFEHLTEEEMQLLRIVRRLGLQEAFKRLLMIGGTAPTGSVGDPEGRDEGGGETRPASRTV